MNLCVQPRNGVGDVIAICRKAQSLANRDSALSECSAKNSCPGGVRIAQGLGALRLRSAVIFTRASTTRAGEKSSHQFSFARNRPSVLASRHARVRRITARNRQNALKKAGPNSAQRIERLQQTCRSKGLSRRTAAASFSTAADNALKHFCRTLKNRSALLRGS